MLHDLQNTVPMPGRHTFVVLGMVFSPQIIIDGCSTLALVCSTTSNHSTHAHSRHTCVGWYGFPPGNHYRLMVYYCFCMFYRLKKRVPMLTANMYVVLGMLTWPKIIIDGWWTLALVCFNTYKKTVPMPNGHIFALPGVVFSPRIIIDGWSTLALVSSTTSKTQYPCPVDTCLQCLVWFFSPQTIIDGWSTLALVCSTTSRKLYPCHGQISTVLGMLF